MRENVDRSHKLATVAITQRLRKEVAVVAAAAFYQRASLRQKNKNKCVLLPIVRVFAGSKKAVQKARHMINSSNVGTGSPVPLTFVCLSFINAWSSQQHCRWKMVEVGRVSIGMVIMLRRVV